MKYLLAALTICIVIYAGFLFSHTKPISYISNPDNTKESLAPTDKYSDIIAGMTLEEKVGQLFIIGHWHQTDPVQTASLIDAHHLGGVIIMSSPPEIIDDILMWTSLWQNTSTYPLTIAIDQEGGPVTRLQTPEYIQIAQPDISSTKEAYDVGKQRGQELHALGINTNFAPVLETSVTPDSFLYNRVFRKPTDIVSFGGAMIRGMRDGGVAAVPKHFPGHEDTASDSHTELPVLTIKVEAFNSHIQHFIHTIDNAEPSALMTAHVQVPSLDSVYPATLSHTILTEKLRKSIGFEGVIITDDMAMQAVTDTWPSNEASLLALQAGADMILFAAKPEDSASAIQHVLDAVHNGTLSEERIDESVQRIFKMKELYR